MKRSGNHTLARALVNGALERYTAEPRQEHEGDAALIVLGAILEEVGARRPDGWSDRVKANILPLTVLVLVPGSVWMFLEKLA